MIRVLLVDDDALTLELHRTYVGRMDGFEVVAECSGARAAISAVLDGPAVDLVLLDMTMPDGTGLDVLRHIRARGSSVDVIAVTGVRDAEAVRQTVGLGVVQYLVKPVTFAAFGERLAQYRDYHRRARDTAGPKGLSPDTLDRVTEAVRAGGALSASEAAAALGMSRVAARRYLEHLASSGRVERAARYRGQGRPETEYRWR